MRVEPFDEHQIGCRDLGCDSCGEAPADIVPSFARETSRHDCQRSKGRTQIVEPLAPLDPLHPITAMRRGETTADIPNTGVVGV